MSTNRPKPPCRFFAQGKCNRGNNCRWSHDLTTSRNHANANFDADPDNNGISWGHNQIPQTAPNPAAVAADETLLYLPRNRAPSHTRGENVGNRGAGSRGRASHGGWRGRPSKLDKGKGRAQASSPGPQIHDDQHIDSSNPKTSSSASYTGNRGSNFEDERGRRGGSSYSDGSATGIQHNTDYAYRIRQLVDAVKNVNINAPSTVPPEPEPVTKTEAPPSTVEKVLAGSMSVRLGPGFAIQSITPISVSSSSIVIENVLPGTPISALQTLVQPFKPSISPHAIRAHQKGDSLRVIVHFDDTVAADEAVKALEMAEFRGRALVVKALKPTAASQDVTQIECSWYPASATAIVQLQTKEIAEELVRQCASNDCPKIIRGRRIKATLQRTERSSILPTVTLVNLDPVTEDTDIQANFRYEFVKIQLRGPKYYMSDAMTLRYIRRKFEIDTEEDMKVVSSPTDSRTRAFLTYASANDAITAFTKVQGENDDMLNKMSLIYNLKYSVSFNIPSDIWVAVKDEVKQLEAAEKERKQQTRAVPGGSTAMVNPANEDAPARLKIMDRRGGTAPVNVYVNGGGRPAVARFKVAIQKLLRGHIICDDEGKPLWDPALRGPEGRKLVQLVMESPVHVHVDYRNRTVTMYGSPGVVAAAEAILKEQYYRLLRMQHELSIAGYSGRFAFCGGIDAVKEYLGEDMVIINHATRKIYVRCSPADVSQVRNLLYKPRTARSDPQGRPATESDPARAEDACPVCMEPAEPPIVKTSCGHTYCKGCITGFVKATIDGRKFPINCFHTADDGTACATPLSISIIHDILSKADSDQLSEAAFVTHIQARPNEYAYCPTPDCPTVYVVTTIESGFTCSQCLLAICTVCKTAAHHGQTCAQYKAAIAGENDFKEWKRRAGVKSCPKCNADIEKNAGCNHMMCKCGAHICWHCMKEFPVDRIYEHMSEDCGGTFGTAAPPVPEPARAPSPLRWEELLNPPVAGRERAQEYLRQQRDLRVQEVERLHQHVLQRQEELRRQQREREQREQQRQGYMFHPQRHQEEVERLRQQEEMERIQRQEAERLRRQEAERLRRLAEYERIQRQLGVERIQRQLEVERLRRGEEIQRREIQRREEEAMRKRQVTESAKKQKSWSICVIM